MRPIDVARKMNLSTSALRNYEAKGVVPPALRSSGGHRSYTDIHLAYFEAIQAMAPGFGMEATTDVLRKIQSGDLHEALWIVNEIQANLHRDKKLADETIRILETQESESTDTNEQQVRMTIGEVSAATSIPSSAIRYWEKEGLITSSRDPGNGYRIFNRSQLRKVMLLRTLRLAVYSDDLVGLKQAIAALDHRDVAHAKEIAYRSRDYLNEMNEKQLRGGYYLFRLCRLLRMTAD